MARRRTSEFEQPSLFDDEDVAPQPPVAVRQPSGPPSVLDFPPSTWREVPAARFNSWSLLRQLAYCRDRDIDGALYAPTDEEALWFKARADSYSRDILALIRGHHEAATSSIRPTAEHP